MAEVLLGEIKISIKISQLVYMKENCAMLKTDGKGKKKNNLNN